MTDNLINRKIGICISTFKKTSDPEVLENCLIDANSILHTLLSRPPYNLKKINSLLFILLPSISLDRLKHLWTEISSIKGIILIEATYTIFIKIFCEMGEKDYSIALLSCMQSSSVQPHYRTYIHILNMLCSKSRRGKQAGVTNCKCNGTIEEIMNIYNFVLDDGYVDNELYEILLSCQSLRIGVGLDIFIKDISRFKIHPISEALTNIIRHSCTENVSALVARDSSSNFVCTNCNTSLQTYYDPEISRSIQNNIVQNIPKRGIANIKKFKNYIDTSNYNILLDAGNIAFYKNRDRCQPLNIFKMYSHLIFNGFNPLIIISQARANGIDLSKFEDFNMWVTPKGINDDIYWLYAVVHKPGVKVLTNDEITDHNLQDYLDVSTKASLKNNCWIRYDMTRSGKNIQILDIPTCDKRLHYDHPKIHIPTESNKCLCFTINF